jgi:hypothetical protein
LAVFRGIFRYFQCGRRLFDFFVILYDDQSSYVKTHKTTPGLLRLVPLEENTIFRNRAVWMLLRHSAAGCVGVQYIHRPSAITEQGPFDERRFDSGNVAPGCADITDWTTCGISAVCVVNEVRLLCPVCIVGHPDFYTMGTDRNDTADLAVQFINSTGSHIFLTGKAGTGKTTLLLDLARRTHKHFLVVAPTGIAALNAKGVTIHSQFLLPLGSFIPDGHASFDLEAMPNVYNRQTLAKRHPLNSTRKQVLRAIDLLVIDEVSMLRADILDAIDYRMRSVKGNFKPSFGGIQVLFIGDLYQLPPIVRENEWNLLKSYYQSMHFFEAQALKEDGLVYMELDKIFRQEDQVFINILNNLRNNMAAKGDIDVLNRYYAPGQTGPADDGVITITTHNYKADTINSGKLDALPEEATVFRADIWGDFPEHLYPLPREIALKPGTRIMFVRNDSSGEGAYYNGKLARIESIDGNEIAVTMDEGGDRFLLHKEKWENKKYTVDENRKEIEDEVVGTFEQYPVKPAWAVTVHKSQGLTFDKAVIDVGSAFAPGQVYVALSRLRSLDGLVLRTKIDTSSIGSDAHVVSYTKQRAKQRPLELLLRESQQRYLQEVLTSTFDFSPILNHLDYFTRGVSDKMEFEEESMRNAVQEIRSRFLGEQKNTKAYRKQLAALLEQNNTQKLFERIKKGSAYYGAFMEENVRMLLNHQADVEQFTRTKTYRNALSEIDQFLMKSWHAIRKALYVAESILSGHEIIREEAGFGDISKKRTAILEEARKRAEERMKHISTKSGRRRKKRKKGETYEITYAMLQEGMEIADIARKRGMATSTIEGHIARGIAKGVLRIHDLVSEDIIDEISSRMQELDGSIGAVHQACEGRHSYGLLRMVQAYLNSA